MFVAAWCRAADDASGIPREEAWGWRMMQHKAEMLMCEAKPAQSEISPEIKERSQNCTDGRANGMQPQNTRNIQV